MLSVVAPALAEDVELITGEVKLYPVSIFELEFTANDVDESIVVGFERLTEASTRLQ